MALDVIRLYNEIIKRFLRDITINDIFENPTVQKLAEFIMHAQPREVLQPLPVNAETTDRFNCAQVDQISINLDNLSDAEVEELLNTLQKEDE